MELFFPLCSLFIETIHTNIQAQLLVFSLALKWLGISFTVTECACVISGQSRNDSCVTPLNSYSCLSESKN